MGFFFGWYVKLVNTDTIYIQKWASSDRPETPWHLYLSSEAYGLEI